MARISEIRTGGQSGVDRAAFDVARKFGIPISGWCPKGGWAEDLNQPPGLLILYPEMRETPSTNKIQRTEWNIRDSSACLVFVNSCDNVSPGTTAGISFFKTHHTPYMTIDIDKNLDSQIDEIIMWLESFEDSNFVFGVGGPKESEIEGIYAIAYNVIEKIILGLVKNNQKVTPPNNATKT